MRILILDDDDFRHAFFIKQLGANNEIVVTHTYDEAVEALYVDKFDCVMLDHDLNNFSYSSVYEGPDCEVELTGMDVCKFMIENVPLDMRPRQVIVHSKNKERGDDMASLLRASDFQNVIRWEFNPNATLCIKKVRASF